MLRKIVLVFRIPELRRKILLTLLLLGGLPPGVPRLPALHRPGRGARTAQGRGDQGGDVDTFMQTISLFTASQLNSIFGLGIGPYITASIIFQLLGHGLSSAGSAAKGGGSRPPQNQ